MFLITPWLDGARISILPGNEIFLQSTFDSKISTLIWNQYTIEFNVYCTKYVNE